MEVICAWCGKQIGEKDGEGEPHGICADCLNHHFPHHADKIREALEVENIEKIYHRRKVRIVPETKIHRR